MSTETITLLNFIVHSLVIGAAAWLLVRFVIRDAMRRCILANLAVLMCLYSPFDISIRDLFPPQQPVPVWTPLRETFEADWRVTVAPVTSPVVVTTAPAPTWDVNDVVKSLRWLSWLVTAALLLRLSIQSIGVQRWAWRLRDLTQVEIDSLPKDVRFERMCVFDGVGTPCVAGWFFPVIAVPSTAFEKLTPRQWRWLIRHESEHLRCHDTVAVLLQNIVRAFLWWNPFIHALIEEYARAREEACDAAAVGETRDQGDYADFLLAWAAKAATQPSCVMSIARSRPARRLKVRLVALMETRGVRKKLGALFVLGCAAFAVLAPFVAASFGIATVAAQEAVKPKADDGVMYTRVYKVAPDFLKTDDGKPHKNARELLEAKGVPFPTAASALYQASSSQLIVRNTRTNLDKIEQIIDAIHTRPVQVYFACKLIQAGEHFGAHGSILSPEEMQTLVRFMSQKKGVDLMSSPNVTTKLNQSAVVEVVREAMRKVPPDGKLSIEAKFLGSSIKLIAKPSEKGKATIEAKVDMGVDRDSDVPWIPKKPGDVDWDQVRTYTVSSQAELSSGETLLLHLRTEKRPVTVLITATALKPDGNLAKSFAATTLAAPPAREGSDMPDAASNTLAVRVYRVPAGFGDGQKPVDYLKANGIHFPKGADAQLDQGKLTVRNTKTGLEFVEALIDSLINPPKQPALTVRVVEVRGDIFKLMNEWFPSPPEAKQAEAQRAAPPVDAALLRQYTLNGIFADSSFQTLVRNLAKSGVKPVAVPSKQGAKDGEQLFDLPAEFGGHEVKIEPVIGADRSTLELSIQAAGLETAARSTISTAVTIWDGQTVLLSAQPTEGVSRILFITGNLVAPPDKK
jgi:beta-lactamase regulating signal transducer with metallopeptidase domain